MTRANLDAVAGVSGLLARLRGDHALTSERLAGLLGEQPAVVAGWEGGRQPASADEAARIQHLANRLDFASLQRWKERMTSARGLEMLIGRDLTILAVSDGVFAESRTSGTRKISFPRETFIGQNANALLPSLECNLILHYGAGLRDLDTAGLFDGRVRCVRYSAELNYGSFARIGVFEFWPVETIDGGVVAHHLCHPLVGQKPVLRTAGVAVHWTEIVPTDA